MGALEKVAFTKAIEAMKIKYHNDFLSSTSNSVWGAGVVILSGSITGLNSVALHPGIYQIKSSTSADSGAYYCTNGYAFLLSGGEKSTSIFKVTTTVNTTIRNGFLYTTTVADPANGAYFEIVGTTLVGKTSKAGTRSTTASNYTITADTWYRFVVKVNADATLITFKLYADNSDTLLWTDTLSTNIPIVNTGNGIIATNSGTTALELIQLDYVDVVVSGRRVA